ncbi:NAD-dependent succinate-semialdehyde dehydrogenase [Plantactinospora veratri]|uniref:NAD-dependent succinate-semialdehyde dehydrogenase n=1 Tax=Plantactinospora veratri TaxID=1436122 RepID=A0ABU7SGM8_9ACTN
MAQPVTAEFDAGLLPGEPGRTLLIAGKWTTAETTFDVLDPATLDVVGRAADAGEAEARAAVDAAVGAYHAWRAEAAEARAGRLRAAVQAIRAHAEGLARLLSVENGKPYAEAHGEILRGAAMLEWGVEEGRRAYGRITPSSAHGPGVVLTSPVGPALLVTPWNFPASMLMRKIGLSLSVGSPVVAKPAEQTPLIAVAVTRLINEQLPPGVLNVLTTSRPAEVVNAVMDDPRIRKVSFTGSTEVGLSLARRPGAVLRRVSLEMGGHSPAIVFPDADLDSTVDNLMFAKFPNAGQSCISINRLFVHRSLLAELTGRLAERIGALRLGRGLDAGVTTGPLIDFAGLAKVERHVEDAVAKGATVLSGGGRWIPDDPRLRGAFHEPTLLTDVHEGMQIAHEETFGPVLPVYPFDDGEDVVARANDTTYGLAAYVFGADFNRLWDAMERLEFGVIGVNDAMPNRPELPFGGFKNSGQGREGGTEGIEDYVETKAIAIKR